MCPTCSEKHGLELISQKAVHTYSFRDAKLIRQAPAVKKLPYDYNRVNLYFLSNFSFLKKYVCRKKNKFQAQVNTNTH